MVDELSVYFENPATDALGYEHVEGFLRCGRDFAELHFKERNRAFRKTEPITVQFDYAEIERVEYIDRWFRPKILVLRTSSPEKLKDFPGAVVGMVELQVIGKSKADAAKASAFLDYKQSEAYLRDSTERLSELRGEGDSSV
jgi:hypothetical protein